MKRKLGKYKTTSKVNLKMHIRWIDRKLDRRIKIIRMNENEFNSSDDEIIKKIVRQNDVNYEGKDWKMKVLRKTNVIN